MITDQKKNKDAIPLQLNSGAISTACKSLEAVAYMHLPAVKEQWSSSRQIWERGSVPDKRGQAGLDWAGQLRFPSALSSSEAKLILRLRTLWGGSAKACPPAAAGNCLQCRGPWNGYGSPVKAMHIHRVCTWGLCDFTNPNLQVDLKFDTYMSLKPHDVLSYCGYICIFFYAFLLT